MVVAWGVYPMPLWWGVGVALRATIGAMICGVVPLVGVVIRPGLPVPAVAPGG